MRSVSINALVVLAALTALVACSGTSGHQVRPALATVHVDALLVSTHLNASGQLTTYHAPMENETVIAADAHGARTAGTINAHGAATLHLPSGAYTVTNSVDDACQPYRLVVRAASDLTIKLACAAP